MSTKIEATDEDDVIEIYSKVVVRRRIPAGVSGPVYVMSCKMNPSKRWEVPCDRIPSSCPWIGYDITEVGDADEDTYRVQLVRAYALPVTPGELQTYARSAGLLKKNKQLRTWFQSQNAKVPLVTAAAIPRVAVELRALVAPALGQSANFYELLILYPDHMLLPLSSEQLAQLMDLYRADTGIIHCWDASSRALTGTVAHTPCAVSLNLSNQPVEIRHAVLATQLLRDAYVETGGTVFAAALDDPERSILLHWDYLRVLPVHSANAPEELAYSTVCDLEKALDIYTDRVECHGKSVV